MASRSDVHDIMGLPADAPPKPHPALKRVKTKEKRPSEQYLKPSPPLEPD